MRNPYLSRATHEGGACRRHQASVTGDTTAVLSRPPPPCSSASTGVHASMGRGCRSVVRVKERVSSPAACPPLSHMRGACMGSFIISTNHVGVRCEVCRWSCMDGHGPALLHLPPPYSPPAAPLKLSKRAPKGPRTQDAACVGIYASAGARRVFPQPHVGRSIRSRVRSSS